MILSRPLQHPDSHSHSHSHPRLHPRSRSHTTTSAIRAPRFITVLFLDAALALALAPAAPSRIFGRPSRSWVLTRMHTRYDRQALSEDLIFREADPILGGRADHEGRDPVAAQPAPDGQNAFQARYVIRHYWTGPARCPAPRYGIWGGPPGSGDAIFGAGIGTFGGPGGLRGIGGLGTGGIAGPVAVHPATELAHAPRGRVKLAAVIRSAVPDLGITAKGRPPRPGEKP